jgi:polyferredoxin
MKMKFKYLLLAIFVIISSSIFSQNNNEFDEFTETEVLDSSKRGKNKETDEFESDEFGSDEFGSNEFGESDEFSTGGATEEFNNIAEGDEPVSYNRLYWAIAILLYTILAGFLVRYKSTRKLRGLFLLIGLVVLGFYRGGPGVISSFQNAYLLGIGVKVNWQAAILFLGLIPITYLFGKVFCGWVCYLGAIQEFLYIDKVKIFQSEKAQKVMKIIRYVAISAIIIQLTFTHIILWNKIGPFKVAINLFSPNLAGYILLAIVLISSVFIHRPFCKMICPVGLLHGFVTKIPGASVLGINNSCRGCQTCSTSCQINAITREGKTSKLDNEECIRCGDCMDDCRISSISLYNKNKEHENKITLKGIKKLNLK